MSCCLSLKGYTMWLKSRWISTWLKSHRLHFSVA